MLTACVQYVYICGPITLQPELCPDLIHFHVYFKIIHVTSAWRNSVCQGNQDGERDSVCQGNQDGEPPQLNATNITTLM